MAVTSSKKHTTTKQKRYEQQTREAQKNAIYVYHIRNVKESAREKFRTPPYSVGTRKKHTPL